MLRHLTVRDFAIVDRVELAFESGFTALTGETGAGKSILVDALALALGGRADSGVVRTGAERAEVAAEFDVVAKSPLAQWLAAQDLAGDDGACLLRRVVDATGRSRAFVNGTACTLQQLKEAGEFLIDIHGQHSHQSLLRAPARRALLDGYAGAGSLAARVADAFRVWADAKRLRETLESGAESVAREREDLEWQTRELAALGFSAEEWEQLNAEHGRLAHAQTLLDAAQGALDALSESDGAIGGEVGRIASRLQHALEYDARLKDIAELMASVEAQVNEAVYQLRAYRERLDLDPARLKAVEQRLDAVVSAARKYRVPPEQLADKQAALAVRLAELGGSADLGVLREKEVAARAAYDAVAKLLTAARRKTGKKLSEQVTQAMQTLAMAGARFEVALEPVETPGAHGQEQIEFLFAAHASTEPRPLSKVASGGELARVSLAIQTVTSEVAQVPTLVFDEVDAGIGGRVAEIVGRMLKDLGRRHQVMCVTHLPQVAACADHQWQVAKDSRNGKVSSRVAVLDRASRVEEIARMLGGVKITETTRRHAAEMLGVKS
ncbi:MAG: DNA repair protein RecN [Burkholderiales bacterium]